MPATTSAQRRRTAGRPLKSPLAVTGGGRARDFLAARDHAIIRILRSEGIRRGKAA
jgi:hypothetical protein